MMRAIFIRDVKTAVKAGSGIDVSLIFFLSAIVLLPFAIGISPALSAKIGAGLLWLFALLSILLGLDRLFQADLDDGSLDIALSGSDFSALILLIYAKIAAHWVTSVLPLISAALPLSLLLNMSAAQAYGACLSLLIGTPAIAALGALGTALTAALPRGGGALLTVLILPLAIPLIIFGIASAQFMAQGGSPQPLYWLSALSLFFVFIGGFGAGAALRLLPE